MRLDHPANSLQPRDHPTQKMSAAAPAETPTVVSFSLAAHACCTTSFWMMQSACHTVAKRYRSYLKTKHTPTRHTHTHDARTPATLGSRLA